MLKMRGASVHAYDPQGRSNAEELLPDVSWFASPLEAADGADILVVLTEWNEFRALDLKQVRKVMRGDVLVDMRNVYPPEFAAAAGFTYSGVGRGFVRPESSATADHQTYRRLAI
jgi:UDPglucose 6-dehydrogenase